MQLSLSLCLYETYTGEHPFHCLERSEIFFLLPDFQYKHGNAIERTDKVSVTLLLSAQLATDTMQMVESCTQNDCKFWLQPPVLFEPARQRYAQKTD